jgi:hypothetical protein
MSPAKAGVPSSPAKAAAHSDAPEILLILAILAPSVYLMSGDAIGQDLCYRKMTAEVSDA